MTTEIEQMIRDEYSGDRNPRPDLLAEKIVKLLKPKMDSLGSNAQQEGSDG